RRRPVCQSTVSRSAVRSLGRLSCSRFATRARSPPVGLCRSLLNCSQLPAYRDPPLRRAALGGGVRRVGGRDGRKGGDGLELLALQTCRLLLLLLLLRFWPAACLPACWAGLWMLLLAVRFALRADPTRTLFIAASQRPVEICRWACLQRRIRRGQARWWMGRGGGVGRKGWDGGRALLGCLEGWLRRGGGGEGEGRFSAKGRLEE
ncbi:hypothetical protein DFH27DRAFT_631456, partial [Peziza echinospora]